MAVITGGASGIGKATAGLLAGCKAKVCICDKSIEAAEAAADEIGAMGCHAWAFELDVSDSSQVAAVFEKIGSEIGLVQMLVTCAGIPGHSAIAEMRDEHWDRVMAVNLSGVMYCMRESLKQMLQARHGCIVNISSICGIMGCSSCPSYSAAKSGVIGLTKSCARRHAEDGIRANVVAPGLTDTPFIEPDRQMGKLNKGIAKIPMGRMGTPEEIAELIAFLCDDAAAFITGQVISPNGGQLI